MTAHSRLILQNALERRAERRVKQARITVRRPFAGGGTFRSGRADGLSGRAVGCGPSDP